jgi:hypothetical protein
MFNADEKKLAQLFSGKRVVIKKNIDKATAAKYKTALNRAGAECEVKLMGKAAPAAPATKKAPPPAEKPAAAPATAPAATANADASPDDGDVAPPPRTDPLGITGDQIEELSASLAPVGSELQDSYADPEEPEYDLSEFDVAPVGADIGSGKKKPDPPPPDTTGLALED